MQNPITGLLHLESSERARQPDHLGTQLLLICSYSPIANQGISALGTMETVLDQLQKWCDDGYSAFVHEVVIRFTSMTEKKLFTDSVLTPEELQDWQKTACPGSS